MYERLPLDFIGLTDTFGQRIHPISGVSTFHYGIDLGWHKYQGEPVYACYDAKVVDEGNDNSLGNYVVLSYTKKNNIIICRYLHLKNRALVKTNDYVKLNQIIGYMGQTGYADGTHLHFEYWVCPNNYKYRGQDYDKYAVNPLYHCYLFDDQTISSSSNILVTKVVGKNLKTTKNNNINQIEVIGENLRCREDGSLNGNIIGYIDFGIYNILDEKISDNYTWYKIDNNKWIANVSTDVKLYLKESDQNSSDIPNLDKYNSFICPKDDVYFINLKRNEKIYFPK